MNDDIMKKIQKLLALATSSNVHEAQAAAAKAQALLVRHNLTLQAVEGLELDYDKEQLAEFSRYTSEKKLALSILNSFFFVQTIRSVKNRKTVVTLVGTPVNVQTATYVYNFLTEAMERLWKSYKKETGADVKEKQSFHWGIYEGLKIQLTEKRQSVETEMGMVLVKDEGLERAFNNYFPKSKMKTSSVNTHSKSAMNAGIEAGKNLKISRAIESENKGGKILALA